MPLTKKMKKFRVFNRKLFHPYENFHEIDDERFFKKEDFPKLTRKKSDDKEKD